MSVKAWRKPTTSTAYTVESHRPVEQPTWTCGACSQQLGDRGEYDHTAVGDWNFCPWCGAQLVDGSVDPTDGD